MILTLFWAVLAVLFAFDVVHTGMLTTNYEAALVALSFAFLLYILKKKGMICY